MKLNNKGYMLVEIIISFAITMGIAFYLMNLTFKFKNTNEDIYEETIYLKDKELITKNIMNDLDNKIITSIIESSKENERTYEFEVKNIKDTQTKEKRILTISKEKGETIIEYGEPKPENLKNIESSYYASYYKKKLEPSLELELENITLTKDNNTVSIQMKMSSLYSEKNFDIKLIALYEDKE